jgi:hypothetical protein
LLFFIGCTLKRPSLGYGKKSLIQLLEFKKLPHPTQIKSHDFPLKIQIRKS